MKRIFKYLGIYTVVAVLLNYYPRLSFWAVNATQKGNEDAVQGNSRRIANWNNPGFPIRGWDHSDDKPSEWL